MEDIVDSKYKYRNTPVNIYLYLLSTLPVIR